MAKKSNSILENGESTNLNPLNDPKQKSAQKKLSENRGKSSGNRKKVKLNRGELGDPDVPTNFTEALYKGITEVFASKNPTQLFSMCWPGTVLDHDRMKWKKSDEVGGNMPESALVRSSLIIDQYVPPAPITQPDGSRVSDRYKQAIDQLGPIPN